MDVKNQKLTSLLNYRFVKKPVTKLLSDSCPSTESTSSMDSAVNVPTLDRVSSVDSQSSDSTVLYSQARVNSVCSSQELDSQETVVYGDSYSRENSVNTPVKNGTSTTAVPETPKSELTSPGSPVFRKKGKGVRMLITDESDESQEPATPSPWLSKEQGIVSNGVSNTSLANRRKSKQIIRQDFDGETELTMQQNEKMNNLMAMFPSQSTEMINSALRNAEWDQEKAIDILISGVNIIRPGRSKKRTKRIVSSDSDGSPPGRPAKKSRISNTDDANDEDYGERTKPDISKEKKIKYLSEVFPNLHRRVLYKALDNNRWHVDDAMIELTNREEGDSSNKKQDALDDEEESYESGDEGADSDDSFEGEVEENSSIKKIILSFFEEATLDELAATPGCSKKRAEIIVSLRPFGDWPNMINTFTTTKGLSYDIISGCKEIIRVREVVVRLMQKCEKIAKEMESVVSCLTRRTDIEESEDSDALQITKQPVYLCDKFQLKPFQMVGLNWLRIMHTQQLNGILADEMGLGKTIQTISFIAHLLEEGEEGPHVVIVPSSTIENWMREFHNWCPTIKVLVYYGAQEDRRVTRQSILYENYDDFNVILTTYNMATGSVEDRSLFKKLDFHYAIFDEGHMLKNMSSLRYQNLMKITSERRLLLTGTPLQNNLLELMSLLCFVMPEMFIGKTDHLKRMFSMITRGSEDKSRSKYEMERIMHAKRIMKPFVLRRLKADVQKQLPQKDDNTQYCQMIPEQKEIYNNLITKFSKAIKEDRVKESNGGSSMLMQLRKVANHPLLVRSFYNDDKLMKMAKQIAKEPSHRDRGALPKFIFEDMAVMNDFDIMKLCDTYKKYVGSFKPDPSVVEDSGKFRAMDKLLQKFHTQGDRVLIFSQFTMMMDIMEEFLQRKGYSYLRLDGSTPVPERQDMLDKYTNDESIFIFMLSTRAGGLGINLTAANVVIIHDIDFNPYNDKQAEDRCHRVGQTREVKVIRLISKDTVEEGMLRCAKDKLKLEKDVIVDEEIDKESARDVASLLKEALAERKV